MFELTEEQLNGMFHLANFEVPSDELVFFGLRGCSPVAAQGEFSSSHKLIEKGTDFLHQRCSIGQWRPGDSFALYAGSTVPNISDVSKFVSNNGNGVNMLAPCYLTDLPGTSDHRYQKGDHGLSSPLGPHRAFRNPNKLPVWRTGDDSDYEGDDRLVYESAFDNLHCSRRMDHISPGYSSRGCQVVAGAAGRRSSNPGGEKGPWKSFIDSAYAIDQRRFRYALFNEGEASRTVALGVEGRVPTIRFGSTGELAEHLQQGLIDAGFDIGASGADGVIGFRTLLAIRDVQLSAFGPSGVDLVAGPATAAEIGITWPESGIANLDQNIGFVTDLGNIDTQEDEFDDAPDEVVDEDAFDVAINRETRPNGKFRWVFRDPVDGTKRYVGGEARFQGFSGIARIKGFKDEQAPVFSHKSWKQVFGPWAALIEATGLGESKNSFSCLNSYDRAAFTFGFFQFAAHTPNDNLILLFRKLLALPEADRYFPDLRLVNDRVHKVTQNGTVSLEGAQNRQDGDNRTGEQGAFMEYLNGDMKSVDASELQAASRLVHWACHSPDHQLAQVEMAVETAKKKVARIANRVEALGTSLDGRPMPQVAMAMDILHQGRGGKNTFPKIAAALKSSNPMKQMQKIGRTDAFAGRIDLVAEHAQSLLGSGSLGKLRYRQDKNDFG
ncbi:peptidoglycan-binding domain-containing protein [Ruegeria jejuensis]|uniref:peptidoglycan-binding domain-containing protein n=1 Tax=Ruegeria jejuensis TaxID=3233338 RepID=UPI00355C8BFC